MMTSVTSTPVCQDSGHPFGPYRDEHLNTLVWTPRSTQPEALGNVRMPGVIDHINFYISLVYRYGRITPYTQYVCCCKKGFYNLTAVQTCRLFEHRLLNEYPFVPQTTNVLSS